MSETISRRADEPPLPGGQFRLFVQKLAFQTLLGLGLLENPLTRRKEVNLPLAKSVLDDLVMLREKTRGNLERDEDEHLSRVIRDLEHQFASLARAENGS